MNEAMGSVVGELIQMNSRMVISDQASFVIGISVIFFVAFAIITVALMAAGSRGFRITLALVLICIGAIVYGVKMPRVREIRACANGPISLETVGSVYDIVKIDGKELVLRVR